MKTASTMVIQDKTTGKYITQAAYELWADGHDLDGLDMWTGEILMAAWISSDDAPTGMDMDRFALVPVE
jgi:hypothetical protein